MEQGNDKPGREKGDPLLYGRISLASERGTDRRLQRGDLEAFQKVGRHKQSVKGGTDLEDFDFEDYDEDEPEPDDADGDASEDDTEDEDA